MAFKGFSKKTLPFLSAIKKNNNKEWFHENKKRYEKEVKEPFLALVDELIPEVRKMEPLVSTNPKDALFRINRDIRFAKDKTPYHTLLKAGFSAEGKKSMLPGFYLGMSADSIHVGGGLFNLDGEGVKAIRNLIAEQTASFIEIVEQKEFKKLLGELKGERAKRLDKTLIPIQEKTAYIANKQFYAMAEIPLKNYLNSNSINEVIIDCFKVIYPLNQFLNQGFK